jgi:alpha-beta hydrolase superfamily lysophospholipase
VALGSHRRNRARVAVRDVRSRVWNGEAVFFAHGIRDVLDPVGLQDQDYYAVRDELGARGYAIAYSSFSENGYDVADAARRTHQLRGLFVSRFGRPAHSYLYGHSLGTLAIMNLAETYPDQYDGVVPACGILGGTQAQLDYVMNVRALFDVFYPGMLPGSASETVPGYVMDGATQNNIIAAVMASSSGLGVIASTKQTPLEFRNSTELLTSLMYALRYQTRGADNFLTFTHGKFPVSNTNTIYSPRPGFESPELFAALALVNAKVDRFDADRAAVVRSAKNFTPSGALRLPTLTLHNQWDPLVPYFHEGIFAERVTKAEATNLLVQRASPAWGFGHCVIPAVDQAQAIDDMAKWVKTGVKPAQ